MKLSKRHFSINNAVYFHVFVKTVPKLVVKLYGQIVQTAANFFLDVDVVEAAADPHYDPQGPELFQVLLKQQNTKLEGQVFNPNNIRVKYS